MAMGRNLRVMHNVLGANQAPQGPYSLVLERRAANEVLLVENFAIAALGKQNRLS